MRATVLSLIFAASLASAQDNNIDVIVESPGPDGAPQNTTITFDQYTPYPNTDGNLDQVIGLYGGKSVCIPRNEDGSQTIDGDNYWFGFGTVIHVSPPVKVDYIECGLE
ncbi:hypothetical protein GGS20DRAFT_587297 [Poronia punctata]|nr:hypothetical protein GGS20DRAFT_587297 [Poronia punctata]